MSLDLWPVSLWVETGTNDAFKILVDIKYRMMVCNYEQISSETTGNTKEDRGTKFSCSMVPLGGTIRGQMSFKRFGRGYKEEFLLGGRTTP